MNQVCGHCGATDVGGRAAGWAKVGQSPLCHPNDTGRPDCYRLVTVYRHRLYQDGGRCPCDGTLGPPPDGVEMSPPSVPLWPPPGHRMTDTPPL